MIESEKKSKKKKARVNIPPPLRYRLQQEINSVCPFCPQQSVETFEVHHIDGDRARTVFDNLILLCRTCHIKAGQGTIIEETVLAKKDELKNFNPRFYDTYKDQYWYKNIPKVDSLLPRTVTEDDRSQRSAFINAEIKGQNLQEAINTRKHILLIGKAGLGKSMELARVANEIQQQNNLPAWFKLKDYSGKTIENLLQIRITHDLAKRLIIFLDGYDEIPASLAGIFQSNLTAFIEDYPSIRVVMSVRSTFFQMFGDSHNFGRLKPFWLTPLNPYSNSYVRYLEETYSIDGQSFKAAMHEANIVDLAEIPFYIQPLVRHFSKYGNLNAKRTKLFESIIDASIEADKKYIQTLSSSFSIADAKIKEALNRMSIVMEYMGKNFIEVEEIIQLLDKEQIYFVRLSGLIDARSEPKERWSFQNNQIQEYLVATQLSKLSFEQVKEFLLFPHTSVIKPSWINTLALLLSTLDHKMDDLFGKLVEWLKEGYVDYLLECEPDKLENDLKHFLFDTIFTKYGTRGTWFQERGTERKLARLVSTDYSIKFLTTQLGIASSRYGILNAIYVLLHVENTSALQRKEIERALIDTMLVNLTDEGIMHVGLSCLVETKSLTIKGFKKLFSRIKHRKDQHFRYAAYSSIEYLEISDENLDYLIEGLQLFHGNHEDRSKVHLASEDRNLAQCFGKLKRVSSYQRIFQLIETKELIVDSIVWAQVIDAMLDHALTLIDEENSLFETICKWFYFDRENNYYLKYHPAIQFFQKAKRVDTIFVETLNKSELSEYLRACIIAQLYSEECSPLLFEQYKNSNINENFLLSVHYQMTELPGHEAKAKVFVNSVKEELGVQLYKYTDEEKQQKYLEKQQANFDVLFNKDLIIKSVEDLIKLTESEEIEMHDVWQIHTDYPGQDHFDIPQIAKPTLETFIGRKERVLKSVLLEKLKRFNNWTNYQVFHIHAMLKVSGIAVSNVQKVFIQNWFDIKVSAIDFELAVTETDSSVKLNKNAVICCDLLQHFDFELGQDKLLELMSFDFFKSGQQGTVGINYLKKYLPISVICSRSIINIKKRLNYSNALENNIDFALENCFEAARNPILEFIKDISCQEHLRTKTLEKFFLKDNDIELIEDIFNEEYGLNKWSIANILFNHNRTDSVRSYAERIISSEFIIDWETNPALRFALKTDSNIAVKKWEELFLLGQLKPNHIGRTPFEYLKSTNHVEDLIRLLDFGYKEDSKYDYWFKPTEMAFNGLYSISQQSDKNLNIVSSRLLEFYELNKDRYPHIQFIHSRIEGMKKDYYMKQSQSFSIQSAVQMLKQNNLY